MGKEKQVANHLDDLIITVVEETVMDATIQASVCLSSERTGLLRVSLMSRHLDRVKMNLYF